MGSGFSLAGPVKVVDPIMEDNPAHPVGNFKAASSDKQKWKEMHQAARREANSFHVLLIADQDQDSQIDLDGDGKTDAFSSRLVDLNLIRQGQIGSKYKMDIGEAKEIITTMGDDGMRGGELSSLCYFQGKLLTCDDRTGWVFELIEPTEDDSNYHLEKYVRCLGGDATDPEAGCKCEWMVNKGGKLYVGSHGRLESKPGLVADRLRWVKVIDIDKETNTPTVTHENWTSKFRFLEEAMNIPEEGYATHEAALWSEIHQQWFFYPRRVSTKKWSLSRDPYSGSNIFLAVNEDFTKVITNTVLARIPVRGCADMAFVPGTGESEILCVRTEEVNDVMQSYVSIFDLSGKLLLKESKVMEGLKLEGIVVKQLVV